MIKRLLRLLALVTLAAAMVSAPAAGAGAEAASFGDAPAAGAEGGLIGETPAAGAEGGLFEETPAESGAAEAGAGSLLRPGALTSVELGDRPLEYAFVAPSGSVYDVWLFPAEEAAEAANVPETSNVPETLNVPRTAHVQLWQGGALVAEGDGTMPALSLRLTAGATYTLRLTGSGRARLEIARHALSRCFALPMALEAAGDAYTKAFARQGDAHWYSVDAVAAGPLALVGIPAEADVRLVARLFDDEGRLLGESQGTAGGACLMGFEAEAGRRYCLRLTSLDGATGLYNLRLDPVRGALPEAIRLSQGEALLEGRSACRLAASLSPSGASNLIYWESSDPGVAAVDAGGRVMGRGVGEAVVTAYAPNGLRDSCRVSVRYVPVEAVRLLSPRLSLCVGDDAAIECDVLPENATDPRLDYEAEPQGVVEVDRRGVLRGLSEGSCVVTVRSADGGFTDALAVTVGPAPKRWRALLVGEQNYASTVAAPRTGSINSVSGLRSMLAGLSFGGAKVRVSTLLDASRDGVLAGIREAFAGAAEGDAALFYITCHGAYEQGMTCFKLYDGSVLTAAELAQALAEVPGEIFVVIDCCGSGGVIGRASGTADILAGVDAVFGGTVGPAALCGSRFRVLASAALEQDSHRISFGGAGESGMATVFARALCEAGGWSLERSARSAMRADLDYDGAVTLTELHAYVSRRVRWYLNLAGGEGRYAQSVQVWPEGDAGVVFERTD